MHLAVVLHYGKSLRGREGFSTNANLCTPIWHFPLLIGLYFATFFLLSIIRGVKHYFQDQLGSEENYWVEQGIESSTSTLKIISTVDNKKLLKQFIWDLSHHRHSEVMTTPKQLALKSLSALLCSSLSFPNEIIYTSQDKSINALHYAATIFWKCTVITINMLQR